MNLLQNRKVNKIGAAFFCLAGLLTASFAVAGGRDHGHRDGDGPEFDELDCKKKDGTLKVFGEVDGITRRTGDLEVKVKVKGFLKIDCRNRGDNIVEAQAQKVDFRIDETDEVDHDGDFKVRVDVEDEVRHKIRDACRNDNWTGELDKIVIEDIDVKLLEDGRVIDTGSCHFNWRTGDCNCTID